MNQITINGPERAIKAGTWAEKNIKGKWNLDSPDPFSGRYNFSFANKIDAAFFALKWVQ